MRPTTSAVRLQRLVRRRWVEGYESHAQWTRNGCRAAEKKSAKLPSGRLQASGHGKRRLEEEFREAIRVRGYTIDTERAYWMWVRQFMFFHQKQHPREMAGPEVQKFLNHLAVDRHVAASTQAQALN